jgi:hypothetical protein
MSFVKVVGIVFDSTRTNVLLTIITYRQGLFIDSFVEYFGGQKENSPGLGRGGCHV